MPTTAGDIYVRSGTQGAFTEVKYVQGGWLTVDSSSTMVNIDVSRLQQGQLVFVESQNKFYKATVILADYITIFDDSASFSEYRFLTSSISNFDSEVSRSAAIAGFGSGGGSVPAGTVSSSAQTIANLNGTNILSGSILTSSVTNFDTEVSRSAAANGFGASTLPSGVVSSSAQVSYVLISNVPSGIVSSSTQTIANLNGSGILSGSSSVPAGTISGSQQITDLGFINQSQTSSMSVLSAETASFISNTFISASAAASGFGSSTLPSGVVSSSAQVIAALPAGVVSSSAQVSYSGITDIPNGIVSSSAQVIAALPAGVVSSSAQILPILTSSITNFNTEVSRSAAAAGFGSGGGSVGTLQQVTDQGTSTTNAITASAFSGSYFDFNTDGNPVSAVAGRLTWNDSDGTLNIGMGYSDVVLQVGQEQHYVVRNNTGTTISNGVAVYASGSTSGLGRIEAAPYTANGLIREVRFLGLATHDISDGVNGVVTRFGYVRDLDTRGTAATPISVGDEDWSVGDILYVHPTVAGKLTNVKPKHAVYVAIVTVRHQSTGVLFVRPFSYGHMDDIHDVSINTSSLAMGDVLVYNSSSDVWENSDSVNLALTASYISPTFISASAAAAGFGSGGGSINTDSFATTGSNTFKGEQIISSSLIVTNEIKGTGSIFLQPDVNDGRKLEIYNTAATDVHIKSNGGLTFLGDDTNYVLVDDYSQTVTVNGVNGVFVNSSLNVSGSLIVTGSINVPGSVINNLTSSFATTASFISDLFISASAVRSGFGTALFPSGLLSSSFQIANDISGAFTSLSSSFASRIAALEGAGGGSGIFTLTGSFYSTTNNIQITGSLSVGSGSFKSFEVNSDGFVVLGDMTKDLNTAPIGTVVYSGSSFYLIS